MSRAPGGGLPARRAVLRWSWRLFRKEWRQHALVLALLTIAVAAAVALATIAYNIAPVGGNAEFGTANAYLQFEEPEPAFLAGVTTAADDWFGAIDPIGHTRIPIPGATATIDYRAQDPAGPLGGPLLALVDGRYPAGDEAAISAGVASALDVTIGDEVDLDGVARHVVGLVENPSDLLDDFVLVLPDPEHPSATVLLLVAADEERVRDFRPPGATSRMVAFRGGGSREDVTAGVAVLMVGAVALFLVSLVATASFVVVAQRRLRQLGLLASIGASERHLRLVVVGVGAFSGVVAAVVGVVLGVAAWLLVVGRIEAAAGYRVDAGNVPWVLVGSGAVLAVGAATAAAWWPARSLARIPVVQALSGRPPAPTPVRRSVAAAIGCSVAGIALLSATGDITSNEETTNLDVLLVFAGTVTTMLGVLLFSPVAIRAVSGVANRCPVAVRLALRDLGRYQARSGAALAAVSLALGIPVAIVAAAGAAERGADAGNLSDRQIVVQPSLTGPIAPEAEMVALVEAAAVEIAALLDDPSVEEELIAVDPAFPADPELDGRWAISLGRRQGDGWNDVSSVYLATPALLAPFGLTVDDLGTELASTEPGPLALLGVAVNHRPGATPESVQPQPLPEHYTSLPGSFMSDAGLAARGWEAASAGVWLLESASPLTDEQIDAARSLVAGTEVTIETRDRQAGLATLRAGATAAGMALALGVLALTVGLLRGQTTADLRTLTASGATRGTRRVLAATTAGALAVLGVALGTIGAYAALTAAFGGNLDDLRHIPIANLALIVVGTPAVAAGTAWLLAGGEPTDLARAAA